MTSESKTQLAMDRMYRWTRHIYDLTRKFYLLGRDHLVDRIAPSSGEFVCEIGCGTARNLIKMAKRYPDALFFGLDASGEMLKTARKSLQKARLAHKITLAQGFAQSFDVTALFGINRPPDKIVFSYSLSIIPPWKESLDHALGMLKSGGEIHIVDFGGQEGFLLLFRKFLFWWLSIFHVYYKPKILGYLKHLQSEGKGHLKVEHLYKDYAWYAVFRKS